jgi:hypothetical protein
MTAFDITPLQVTTPSGWPGPNPTTAVLKTTTLPSYLEHRLEFFTK